MLLVAMTSVCKGLEVSETISEYVISRTVDLATVVVTSMYCGETFANLAAQDENLWRHCRTQTMLLGSMFYVRCIKHEPGYKQFNQFEPYWNHFILVGRTMPVEQLLC